MRVTLQRRARVLGQVWRSAPRAAGASASKLISEVARHAPEAFLFGYANIDMIAIGIAGLILKGKGSGGSMWASALARPKHLPAVSTVVKPVSEGSVNPRCLWDG